MIASIGGYLVQTYQQFRAPVVPIDKEKAGEENPIGLDTLNSPKDHSLTEEKTSEVEEPLVIQDLRTILPTLYTGAHLKPIPSPEDLIKELSVITNKAQLLSLWSKVEKMECEQKQWNQSWKAHLWRFNEKGYVNPSEDQKGLQEAIEVLDQLQKCAKLYKDFDQSGLITAPLRKSLLTPFSQLFTGFSKIVRLLQSQYRNKEAALNQGFQEQIDKMETILKEEAADELDPVILEFLEEHPNADHEFVDHLAKANNLSSSYLWRLFKTVFNCLESSDKKDIQWKIKKYEDIHSQICQLIQNHFKQPNLETIKQFEIEGKRWQKALLPVLQALSKEMTKDKSRFNQSHLQTVRQLYQDDFIPKLREAARWSKEHQDQEGVEHIDALCWALYTQIDLNPRCDKIVKTFRKIGEKGLPKVESAVEGKDSNSESSHFLIKDLLLIHRQIEAVPMATKAPKIKLWMNSLLGHINSFSFLWLNFGFDPNTQANPIHHLLTIKIETGNQEKLITDIAMGTPTIQTNRDEIAQVNEEFLGFLRHCKRHKLKHLYKNHQDMRPKSWLKGNESLRCQALHALKKEFPDVLDVITSTNDSDFYYQKGYSIKDLKAQLVLSKLINELFQTKTTGMATYLSARLKDSPDFKTTCLELAAQIHKTEFKECPYFTKVEKKAFIYKFHSSLLLECQKLQLTHELGFCVYVPTAISYKKELRAQLFDRNPDESGNYISKELVEELNLRHWSEQMSNTIHEYLFGNKQELTKSERLIFSDLFELFIELKVSIEKNFNSKNSTCKDRSDRACAEDGKSYAYRAIIQDEEQLDHVKSFFETMLFSRAIIIRKRSIIFKRLKRMMGSVHFMLDHKIALKQVHEILFPGVKISTVHQVPISSVEKKDPLI